MKNNFFIIKEFLSDEECDLLLEKCNKELQLSDAEVYNPNNVFKMDMARKSKVSFVLDLGELNIKLESKILENVKIKGYYPFLNQFQFTKYDVGDYFDWHRDSNDTIYKDRYYTAVIQLNNNYIGGDLQIIKENNEITLESGKGNLYLFPSNTIHRVVEIKSGIRYSLVNWLKLKPIENHKKTLL